MAEGARWMMYDLDTRLDFGKYRGQTVEAIIESDARYLVWCLEEVERFEVDKAVHDEIMRKAHG